MSAKDITDHEMAIAESQLAGDDALQWAEIHYRERGTWPVRRWRVEGTPAGNSRFLRHTEALAMQSRYGGKLVELIPEPDVYREICQRTQRKCVLDEKKKRR